MNLPILESIKPWLNFFHPAIMWILLALTIYALYLGIKVRNSRTATDTEKKKEFAKFKIKHHQVGSFLLAFMVLGSLGGMAVTYINNGKLFFGPHLLAGLGMTGAIAISASLTPFMQKGQDWARYSHIVLNVSILGLFSWQAVTGVQILLRIISNI
ncbi:MAG: DUF4079 domain-containing protein [Okeania sp. SIO2C2]|uniref:DUF4079 domain-containing protein n=1 Tax=Okeania sp. SIO2C2 TaxID=2607787 RepID=UPI0013B6B9D1|nr:DUF4079 domain-containing protein [Okeania sp. SIO2C2]NEP87777.1 DUF4079 domain-containing protein [Okeania sp. SIO2C2]